jgi:hypothetical protein
VTTRRGHRRRALKWCQTEQVAGRRGDDSGRSDDRPVAPGALPQTPGFLRHGLGCSRAREKKGPATSAQRGGCLGRTVGRVIPRRVASPQSPTPFHPAGSWYQRTSRRRSEAEASNEDRLNMTTAWLASGALTLT